MVGFMKYFPNNGLLLLLLLYLDLNFLHWSGGFSVFAGVGERTREGNDLYREMIESGVIKLGDKQVSKAFFMSTSLWPLALIMMNFFISISFH